MSTFRPVFIGGAGRSGTTLLVDLLGTHASLSPVYETNFVLGVARELLAKRPLPESAAAIRRLMQQWTEPLPHRPHHKRPDERYLHGPHYILFERDYALEVTETLIDELATDPIAAYRRFVGSLFARHAELDGKPFWVNKTPTYVAALPFLKEIWPDFVFIHCVRDGRDAAASALTRSWGPNTWSEAGTWWRDQVRPGLEFAERHPGPLVALRYEDVLASPTEALERVLGVLGLDGASATVERYLAAGAVLDATRTGRWRREAAADIEAFEVDAGATLRALGYQPAFAHGRQHIE
jgi:hypothetical protein